MAIKFDDVVLFARTGLNPRDNFKLGQGDNHYITIKNIKNNKLVIDENTDVVNDEAIKLIHKRSQIKKGDILFCSIGRMGDMYIIEDEPVGWDINESVFAFTLNTDIIRQKYFYYIFKVQATLDYLSSNSSGSTFKSIKMNQLKKMEFNVPSLQEQDKIVYALDKVSKIIEARKSELVQLDNLIKSRFVEMFGDRFINDKQWNTKKLGECMRFNNGKAHEQVVDEKGEYILITSRAIASDLKDVRRTNALLFPLHRNDIVMVMSDIPNGRALAKCLLIDSDEKYTLNQRICSFDNYEFEPIFLELLLNRHQYFLDFNDGNGQTNLRKNDILECDLIVPPIELQKEFATFVRQVDKLKFEVQKSLDETQILMDSLMQQYFG